jgi:plastocyanin
MSKEGYRTATIQHTVRTLRAVARQTNLLSPESAKDYLAKTKVSETRKVKICEDLDRFYKYKQIPFTKPRYREIETLPFIPLEMEITQLISGMGRKTACFLQLLRETGMRLGEAFDLKWTDLGLERGVVTVLPEKHSHSRQLKISSTGNQILQTATGSVGKVAVIVAPAGSGLGNINFSPANFVLVIGVNNTFILKNEDTADHTMTSRPGAPSAFDTGDISGLSSSTSITLTVPGTYSYYCQFHPSSMHGTITVIASTP